MFIDTVSQLGGGNGVFGHGRSSGLDAGFLSLGATPVGNIIDGVLGVGEGIIAPAFNEDYQLHRANYRSLRRLIPYQNVVGLSAIHSRIEEAFPESKEVE